MGITFRHDAAAVVPPSNQSTRKYGQSLVLQQNTQKYNQQQAGYDRLFALGRDNLQNQAQAFRDNRINAFQVGRDKTNFEQQQQVAEAERQRQFMDDARKLSSGMIMDDIQNGHYDPITANKLRQNLVDEAEALANPGLDAPQRAKVLQDFKAQRLLLTANRMEKPSKPAPQPNFHTDANGNQWVESGPGKWAQVQPTKEQQQQQKQFEEQQQKLQQDAEQLRPKSFEEHYNHPDNKGQFQKDLSAKLQEMESERDPETTPKAFTKEDALKKMREDYDFQQQALGKVGEPTLAPPLPAKPMDMTVTPPDEGVPPSPPIPTGGQPTQAPPQPSEPPQSTAAAEYDAQMTAQGYKLVTPADGGRPYYYKDATAGQGSSTIPATPGASQNAFEEAPSTNQPAYPPSDWEELMAETPAATPAAPTPSPAAPTPASPQASAPAAAPQAPTPDFGKLTASAADDADRSVLGKLQGVYEQSQSPEIKSAISVLVNPDATPPQKALAARALKAAGINLDELTAPPPSVKETTDETMRKKYGESYNSF